MALEFLHFVSMNHRSFPTVIGYYIVAGLVFVGGEYWPSWYAGVG